MPDVAIRPRSYEERSNLSATLLAHCDRAANIYSLAARRDKKIPAFCEFAPPEVTGEDLLFLSWVAELGFREGLAIKNGARP